MKRTSLFIGFILLSAAILAQDKMPAFWQDIQQFKKMDSAAMPATNQILFIGSSSFTKWQDVQTYFPGKPILNRGFGGSSFPDLIRYAGDIIYPYQPKQVVIYCGDNDLASSDLITPDSVVARFKTLFSMIRKRLPAASIVFVSIKPSESRRHLMPRMEETNTAIKQFLAKKKRTAFVDVYHPMLNAQNEPNSELFIEDKLHMNEKGYAIWQRMIEPHLLN